MSGNVCPNSGFIFSCSLCDGNVTWGGRSVRRCTCLKWVDLGFNFLFSSDFNSFSSFHSWICSTCYILVSARRQHFTTTVSSVSGFSSLYPLLRALTQSTLPLSGKLFPSLSLNDILHSHCPISNFSFGIFFKLQAFPLHLLLSLSCDTLRIAQ